MVSNKERKRMNRMTFLIVVGCMQANAQASTVELSPGVLVDAEAKVAFAVNPAGYTQRLNLDDGSSRWMSVDRVFPLTVADGVLISFGAPDAPGGANLVFINPEDGSILDRVSFDLPEQISANYFPNPKQRFSAQAVDTPAGARVFWRHERQELRGAAILELDQAGNESINPITVTQGAFDVVRDGDRFFAIPVRTQLNPPQARPLALSAQERIPGVSGAQHRAANDRHVQVAQASPDETFGQLWAWQIYDRDGARQARYSSPFAYAPFVLSEQTLVIRQQPYSFTHANAKATEFAARLLGVDAETGREIWSFDVLDQEYRGPLPP
jgi:hypothetical protein